MLGGHNVSQFLAARISQEWQAPCVMAVEPEFDFRSGHFLKLFGQSSATAFQHPLWLDAFYRLIAPHRGAEKLVVTARDESTGALRMVLPFVIREANGMTVIETADLGVSDHAAPIVASAWPLPESIREDIADALPRHDLLRVRPVGADMLDTWRDFIDGDTHSLDFFGPATELSGPFPQWRSGAFGQVYRKEVDADARRQFKSGATELKLLTDSAEIAHAIETIRVCRAGRFELDPIQERPVCDFYTSLAVSGAGAGFSRTYALIEHDRVIGHVFGLSWMGRFHYLLVGCDFTRHGRHTTGLILHDTMVEDWIGTDSQAFNFTIGDEAFKLASGKQAAEMFVVTRAPTWRGRLSRAALNANDHVERMQRGTIIN